MSRLRFGGLVVDDQHDGMIPHVDSDEGEIGGSGGGGGVGRGSRSVQYRQFGLSSSS